MGSKPVQKPVKKPLEGWCSGSDKFVKTPRNQHIKCKVCGRIVSVISDNVRAHRNIDAENRYMV